MQILGQMTTSVNLCLLLLIERPSQIASLNDPRPEEIVGRPRCMIRQDLALQRIEEKERPFLRMQELLYVRN